MSNTTVANQTEKQPGVLRSMDWWTILIYVGMLVFGWVSVCGASYTYGDTDLLSFDTNSGKQAVWMGASLGLALFLLLLDDRFYEYFAYFIYGALVVLLVATIFNPHEIKGSRSWLVLGPLRLQPAEFAKFATALCVAKVMTIDGFDIRRWKDFALACAVVLLPMGCIVLQKETGSALVYLSFFLMFYREGMPGSILFTAVAMIAYFVLGIKYESVMLWETPTSLGRFVVLLLVQLFTAGMMKVYTDDRRPFHLVLWSSLAITLLALLFSKFVIPFDIVYVQMALCAAAIGYLVYLGIGKRVRNYFFIALFSLGSVAFFNMADYALNHMLQEHQRSRINVLLGLDVDIRKEGYNVHQSEIAIGSGGLTGKGFLNGTQTKLKYVPEQSTDFIFCTVGEEEGFVGCAGVLGLFLLLILRLIHLAERQAFKFGRVYGYCVLSIFLFHLFINVGMVLGLTPVIGIPLPFFSYGGSSLWGFTFLLFIFLRIDAGRNLVRT